MYKLYIKGKSQPIQLINKAEILVNKVFHLHLTLFHLAQGTSVCEFQ